MSSSELYLHSDVVFILPEYVRGGIEFSSAYSPGYAKRATNYAPLVVALGVIVLLAGLFLALSAHQMLPFGVNSMSNMGVNFFNDLRFWEYFTGYLGMGVGFGLTLAGSVKRHSVCKQNRHRDNEISDASSLEENEQLEKFLLPLLEVNELFVEQDPEQKCLNIYIYSSTRCTVVQYDDKPCQALENWRLNNSAIVEGKQFITLDTLKQRAPQSYDPSSL